MKVYVDELPKSCEYCVCCNQDIEDGDIKPDYIFNSVKDIIDLL